MLRILPLTNGRGSLVYSNATLSFQLTLSPLSLAVFPLSPPAVCKEPASSWLEMSAPLRAAADAATAASASKKAGKAKRKAAKAEKLRAKLSAAAGGNGRRITKKELKKMKKGGKQGKGGGAGQGASRAESERMLGLAEGADTCSICKEDGHEAECCPDHPRSK